MIETMPDKLFKFLEANTENWGLHERLDPCLNFHELDWSPNFGWNLDLGFDLDLEYYLDYEMGHYLDYEMGYYLDLDFYYYRSVDRDLGYEFRYLTALYI